MTCQIGISMATRNFSWGILTSGLVTIFFHRHVVRDSLGEPHHILSCSEPVYVDAIGPSIFSLCAVTLLGAEDPQVLNPRPVRLKFTVPLYDLPPAASPSMATRSRIGRHRGSHSHPGPSSAPNPGSSTLAEYRAGVHEQHWWKVTVHLVFIPFLTHICPRQCPTLCVQFVASYWPELVYNVCRVRQDAASRLSGHTEHPPYLRLDEILGRGKSGQVLNGFVSIQPDSGVKHNVIAKLFLQPHLDQLHNEIHLYETRLTGLGDKAVPKVFGAFVTSGHGPMAAVETMEKWGIIVMERCGSTVQSIGELTMDQR